MTRGVEPRSTTAGGGEGGVSARTFCHDCVAAQAIVETHAEVLQEFHGQRGVIVTLLSCGHEQVRSDGSFYPFGGSR